MKIQPSQTLSWRTDVSRDGALLYDPDSRDGLAGALRAGRDLDLEMASRAAPERALEMSWSLIVEKTERAYEMA